MMNFGKYKKVIGSVLNLLRAQFDLKVLRRIRGLIRSRVCEEKKESLEIYQWHYTDNDCDRFKKFHFPISSLPISKFSVHSKLSCPVVEADINEMAQLLYRSVLGCYFQ